MSLILNDPPILEQDRELWLQHAAGFIIFQDMRNYAISKIEPGISSEQKAQIINSIDDTIYGLMMIMDGVSGVLSNEEYQVRIESKVLLERGTELIQEINTLDGDGMCIGFHGWKEDDFGEDAILKIE